MSVGNTYQNYVGIIYTLNKVSDILKLISRGICVCVICSTADY